MVDYEELQDLYWTDSKVVLGLSATNPEDSMCTLQTECSSSVTKLHPSNGRMWSLDPTRQMKDPGE